MDFSDFLWLFFVKCEISSKTSPNENKFVIQWSAINKARLRPSISFSPFEEYQTANLCLFFFQVPNWDVQSILFKYNMFQQHNSHFCSVLSWGINITSFCQKICSSMKSDWKIYSRIHVSHNSREISWPILNMNMHVVHFLSPWNIRVSRLAICL